MYINKKISKYNHYKGRNSIEYIVIHSTGNINDTAKNNVDYFSNAYRGSSAHFFIDNKFIWQSVDENNTAWHVGDGHGKYGITNRNSIGIEMCGTDNGNISNATINLTIELVQYLMKKYNIDKDHVVTHYNASKKCCPYQFSKNNWERWIDFKKRLSNIDIHSCENLDGNIGICTGNGVRVRSTTDISSCKNILGYLYKGYHVKIFKKVGNMYELYYGPHGGYVHQKYIKLI